MEKPRCSFMVLFILPLASLFPETQATVKRVCRGDSVQLFYNIQINSDIILSLYLISDTNRIVAIWSIQINTTEPEYSDRLRIDGNNTLWILNVLSSDGGKYWLFKKENEENSSSSSEVEISVMSAPDTSCKIKIKQLDYNILRASLEDGNCGEPSVTVYWLEYFGVHYEGKDVAKLQHGREMGTYYACIEGPALSCAKRSTQSSYHCSAFAINESSIQSDTGGSNDDLRSLIVAILVLVIILVLLFPLATVGRYIYNRKKKTTKLSGEKTTTTTGTTSGNMKNTVTAVSPNMSTTATTTTETDLAKNNNPGSSDRGEEFENDEPTERTPLSETNVVENAESLN